jgi:hypothetical protein
MVAKVIFLGTPVKCNSSPLIWSEIKALCQFDVKKLRLQVQIQTDQGYQMQTQILLVCKTVISIISYCPSIRSDLRKSTRYYW